MKHTRSIALVLTGIMLGCGAAAVAPMATSVAQDTDWGGLAGWSCYAIDRFPDTDDAQSWEGATNIARGLNQVADGAPAGTLLEVTPKTYAQGSYASVVCVKK